MSSSQPRRLKVPCPTNIVTGALASGKTTVLKNLLLAKPPEEVWAVLVNEFGAAGLDAALLEEGGGSGTSGGSEGGRDGAGVHIQQLAGGCLCCAMSNVTPLAIAQLLRQAKPDRLWIEPSGLAHPAALLDMLQGEHLGPSLAVQPVMCLVDATQFQGGPAEPACWASPLLRDQISIADVVVGSKADLVCDDAALEAFHSWARQLFPPKRLVATARHGRLDAAAHEAVIGQLQRNEGGVGSGSQTDGLQQGAGAGAAAEEPAPQAGVHGLPVQRHRRSVASTPWLSSSVSAAQDEAPPGRQPLRKQVQDASGAYAACGWIFHRDCVFDRARLLGLLRLLVPRSLRVKGIFRVHQKTWVAVSAAPEAGGAGACHQPGTEPADGDVAWAEGAGAAAVQLTEVAYRRDSRVEVILEVAACCGSLAQQAAAVGLEEPGAGSDEGSGTPTGQAVDAALRHGASGDWEALEALVIVTLAD